jgi:hypothetical protein
MSEAENSIGVPERAENIYGLVFQKCREKYELERLFSKKSIEEPEGGISAMN